MRHPQPVPRPMPTPPRHECPQPRLRALQAQVKNVTTVDLVAGATVPYNTLITIDAGLRDIKLNGDGSFTLSRGIYMIDWQVDTTGENDTDFGFMVDGVINSANIDINSELVNVRNESATIKVIATAPATLITPTSPNSTQANIRIVRVTD